MKRTKPPPPVPSVLWEGAEFADQTFRLVGTDTEPPNVEVLDGEQYRPVAFAPDPEDLQHHVLSAPNGAVLLDRPSTTFARRCITEYWRTRALPWGARANTIRPAEEDETHSPGA